MIEIRNLTKAFRGRTALHDLSMSVSKGTIAGLLGHNGAGKSTTFGMMLGQIHPDSGEAWINGISVQHHRSEALQQVGAIFEAPAFYDYLSGWTNLKILTSCSRVVPEREIRETVEVVGLSARIHDPVRVYSHGMRQRLALAQALLPAPELVLLDEPTEGLDPEGIHEIRSLIQRLNRERGLTVLFSSHLLSEVEQLCEHVVILHAGRKRFDGRWSELATDRKRVRVEVNDWDRAVERLRGMAEPIERGLFRLGEAIEIADCVAKLVEGGIRVSAVEPVKRGLEEIYLETIGGNPQAESQSIDH